MSETESHFLFDISPAMKGQRVDKVLAELMPEHTRGAVQGWISEGFVQINGSPIKQKFKLSGNEQLEVFVPQKQSLEYMPENMPLDIVFEDEQILVINKPVGLVVHPGAGNSNGTLMNGLLYYQNSLSTLPRAGIVHRLDKDTSGIMVVAKTEKARQHLIHQLDVRSMKRQYLAVVEGLMISGETIDQAIGRNRNDRLKMCVTASGKPAITHVRVLEKYRSHTLVQANLESGRTHQIRVHLSWRGFTLVGDSVYGNRKRIPPSATPELIATLQNFKRQALHAQQLTLLHPDSNEEMTWTVDTPQDMQSLLESLESDRKTYAESFD
jgi:23S rRNA pseudouridine1911/1915/1917 synthase